MSINLTNFLKLNKLIYLDYSLLAVSGINAKKFLQGQLSCDLENINQVTSSFGSYCNSQGRILAFFRLSQHAGSYLLRLPSSIANNILLELNKYGQFSKINIKILNNYLVYGIITNQPFTIIPAITDHADYKLINIDQQRFELYAPNEFVNSNHNAQDKTLWELLEIKAKIPEIYPATQAEFLPHNLNLPALSGVSFNKGCYRGQEIIARMQYRGKTKRSLYLCTLSTKPHLAIPGDSIITLAKQEHVGTIVRTAQLEQEQLLALLELPISSITEKLTTLYGNSILITL